MSDEDLICKEEEATKAKIARLTKKDPGRLLVKSAVP
jgi:hypothetical protein